MVEPVLPALKRKRRLLPSLRSVERFAVAMGALVGVVAFVWQCQVQSYKEAEIIKPLFSVVTGDGGRTLVLQFSIFNIGERTVFLTNPELEYKKSNAATQSDAKLVQYIQLFAKEPENTGLQPGAGRVFRSIELPIQQFRHLVQDSADDAVVIETTQRGTDVTLSDLGGFFRKVLIDAEKPGGLVRTWPLTTNAD